MEQYDFRSKDINSYNLNNLEIICHDAYSRYFVVGDTWHNFNNTMCFNLFRIILSEFIIR